MSRADASISSDREFEPVFGTPLAGVVTVTVNVAVAVLPAASLAVQVTFVTPGLKVVPEAGVQVTVGGLALSVAVGLVYVTATPDVVVAVRVRFGGCVMTGFSVSTTVIENEPVVDASTNLCWLPPPSLSTAVQLTTVVPNTKNSPDA